MSELTSFRMDKYEVYDRDEADHFIAKLISVRANEASGFRTLIAELEAEVNKIRAEYHYDLIYYNRERAEQAEAERDALKCCGNCGHDRAADDCCDNCTVDAPRWTRRENHVDV